MGLRAYGKKWEAEMTALNTQASLCIRANTLKTSPVQLQAELERLGIPHTDTDLDTGFVIPIRKNIVSLECYQQGWFEIQDISSQRVALALDLAPGMTLIDACSGAGGKTLHAAALMQNKGSIIAIDVYPDKLDALKMRARRAGVTIINAILYQEGLEREFADKADRLLLDVPCTGSGVIRRDPDAKWRLTSAFVTEVCALQRDILHRYAAMTKVGGQMVYATCSIFKEENEEQIQHFVATHQEFELVSETRISPADSGFDGFYWAVLKRK
jgi:16S rRNA (cytosine967-C5)-methyltransferase